MKKFLISSAIFIVILSAAVMLFARSTDPAHQEKNRIVGEVTAIDSGARRLTIRTDGGKTIILSTDEATTYRRVPPNERSLEKAVAISFPDISVVTLVTGDPAFLTRLERLQTQTAGSMNPGLPGDVLGGGVGDHERP